ncbi:MAG TPA: hypothetical protein VMW50_03920 [Dehalococcoidia bacterium]|nr:hypothetical protein [Dehalococcoidia bacterium]
MRAAFVLLFLPLIFGCASSPTTTSQGIKEQGLPIHGEFCGPNIPTLKSTDKRSQLAELQRIPPIDNIDASCKRHDICYAKRGYFNEACDKALIDDMRNLLRSNTSDTSCLALSYAIIDYFRLSNPSSSTIGGYADTAISGLAVQGSNLWMSTGATFYRGYASFAVLMYSPVLLLMGMSPSQIGELAAAPHKESGAFDYYPSRFKKCIFANQKT